MFKRASFEDEIRLSMEKQLVSSQTEQTHGFDKLAKVLDYLKAASEIFDNAEMPEISQDIDQVLNSLAQFPTKLDDPNYDPMKDYRPEAKTVNIGGKTYPKVYMGESVPSVGAMVEESAPHRFVAETDDGSYYMIRTVDGRVVGVEEL